MKELNSFAIDLLWVRVGKVGGSESFIRNLILGFQELQDDFEVVLVVAKDNAYSFAQYTQDKRFSLLICPVESMNVRERILFQNFRLSKLLKDKGICKCFEPVYSTPLIGTKKIDYFTVIHDLQALHFPHSFSKMKLMWLKISWKHTVRCAKKIIAISNFTKTDIIDKLGAEKFRIEMIYNPVVVNIVEESRAREIVRRYGVNPGEFFFCVTSMMPHKNIDILIEIMSSRADKYKLLVCGVGGSRQREFIDQIRKKKVENKVILAPFVSDEERDSFYQECKLFLFPSIFEGFGMPPVEALLKGKPVITTNCTSIPEVTFGKAKYVSDPKSCAEWNLYIDKVLKEDLDNLNYQNKLTHLLNPFDKALIAKKYLALILGGERE